MKKFIVCLIAIATMGIAASAANYTVNDAAIDAMIECAAEASPLALDAMPEAPAAPAAIKIGGAPEPIIAWVLSFIPVTSWLAIHRMYMGTDVLPVVLNIITGAGFGIVYVIDWIVLLIGFLDGDISAYCNNPRWWMWADII